ncbi:tail fiber domain-containing protein, partial [Accumulibacter sp.]|uniref:tail fiber domain-containing protein n=1 Tax=Accumulibacter sp. TaxID=2053492 RepID=UPI0025EF0B53
LAANSVDAAKIVDGSIGTAELAAGAVTSDRIADQAVTGGKLASDLAIPGRVGVGVAPAFRLDVGGRMRVRQTASGQETAGVWLSGYYGREFDAAFVGMQTQNAVGIWGNPVSGSPAAGWRLTLTLDQGALTVTGNAFKPGGGAWGTLSDVRLKQEIAPLSDAVERLLKLKPISFEWKEPEKQGNLNGLQMGFLAQDVEAIFPEWVGVDPQGFKTLTIRGFEALAVEALKQLKAENDGLREMLGRMQQRIDALERRRSDPPGKAGTAASRR